jgi:hypothetical protein
MRGPFWRYFGGKWRAAGRYPEPRYRQIVESFAGAAGYSSWWHWHDVLLIDKSPDVCETWEYLIGVKASEIRALPDLKVGVKIADLAGVPKGARLLMGWWANLGTNAPRQTPTGWALRRGHWLNWNWGGRERVAAQLEFIRHWRIMHGTFQDAPDIEASWFIDPPYQIAGKHYPHGSAGIDYAELADWCQSRKGQATVCEAAGATWLPFTDFGHMKASNGKGRSGVSHEAIWLNQPQPQIEAFA